MSILSRITDFLRGSTKPSASVAPRRARRAKARARHHVTGEPARTAADRRLESTGSREVQDVAQGTPGSFGSQRTIDDE